VKENAPVSLNFVKEYAKDGILFSEFNEINPPADDSSSSSSSSGSDSESDTDSKGSHKSKGSH